MHSHPIPKITAAQKTIARLLGSVRPLWKRMYANKTMPMDAAMKCEVLIMKRSIYE